MKGRQFKSPNIGQRFGMWVVTAVSVRKAIKGRTRIMTPVRCLCGTETEVIADTLRRGLTRSCGKFECKAVAYVQDQGGLKACQIAK